MGHYKFAFKLHGRDVTHGAKWASEPYKMKISKTEFLWIIDFLFENQARQF